MPENCEVCASFYRVDRPLIQGALDHSFVAARYVASCGSTQYQIGDVQYGLTKGPVDISYFTDNLNFTLEGLTFLGQACDARLSQAHSAAATTTMQWISRENNTAVFVFDILVTPLAGRPCGNTADAIQRALDEIL